MSARLKTIVVLVCVAVVAAVGCSHSHTVSGNASAPSSPPSTSKPPTVQQSALIPNYVAEQNPKQVLQDGLYSLLRPPLGDSVVITGYRSQAAPDGVKAATATFAFNPMAGSWEPLPDDAPRRITLQAANDGDAAKFTQALGVPLKHFALFEYDNQVTIGYATPANTTSDSAAGYNRIAVNDILARWTPAPPPVQP